LKTTFSGTYNFLPVIKRGFKLFRFFTKLISVLKENKILRPVVIGFFPLNLINSWYINLKPRWLNLLRHNTPQIYKNCSKFYLYFELFGCCNKLEISPYVLNSIFCILGFNESILFLSFKSSFAVIYVKKQVKSCRNGFYVEI
jgi:hypothetical protein